MVIIAMSPQYKVLFTDICGPFSLHGCFVALAFFSSVFAWYIFFII